MQCVIVAIAFDVIISIASKKDVIPSVAKCIVRFIINILRWNSLNDYGELVNTVTPPRLGLI